MLNVATNKIVIGQAAVDRVSFKQAVAIILELAKSRDAHYVVTPNADHVLQLENDAGLREVYSSAALVTCDGKPLLWASHVLGKPLPQTVTGADLLPALCKHGAPLKLRIALVGGPPGSAATAGLKLAERYPGLHIALTDCPELGFEKNAEASLRLVSKINAARVDVLFLGVGAPKQEKWMFAHRQELKLGVMLGIGAAIEFAAGTTPRAPKFLRLLGLEWAYRLAHDPRRLLRRYVKDLKFFAIVWQQWRRRGDS